MKGTYTLDLEWTNLMCVSTSPYYKVGLTENDELDVDSPPYASAGDDQTVGLSGGSAEVSLDGSGSFDDGDITEYQWDFGDNTTAVTTTPHTMHVYHAAGEYYVSLIVKDDSGQDSKGRWSDSTVVTVNG
jgi:chitodextrinase